MNKRLTRILLPVALFLILMSATAFAGNGIRLWIHGDFVESDVSPVIKNDRTLVPIRVVTENLGYKVQWDEGTRKVTVENPFDGVKLTLFIGNPKVEITTSPGKTRAVTLDVAPEIIRNRTMVPLRGVAELCGEEVSWDEPNRVAVVGKNYRPQPIQNYEHRIKALRAEFDYKSDPDHRNIGYTELAYKYEEAMSQILADEVMDLMNNKKFKATYPSYEDYINYYTETLKNYLTTVSQDIDFEVSGNDALCAADFAIYEIYRLDKIYNHRGFDFEDYTMYEEVELAIHWSRLIYNSTFDNFFKLPTEYRNLLGKHTIVKDEVAVHSGPGEEFDAFDTCYRGQSVEVFDIAYADNELWVNLSPQNWFYIKASAIQ